MEDCYKILGVSRNATVSEIKRAYRKKAKELHPDLASNLDAEQKSRNEQSFQKILLAYETLSNKKSRFLFDANYASYSRFTNADEKPFDYRTWLLERGGEEDLCKLVFFDLMHNREDEACALFKELNSSRVGFSLSRFFTREDFMDYGFILAEELTFRYEYYDAAILLEQIIRMEYSYNYFKLFFSEVVKLALDVFTNHVAGVLSDELAIDVFERALELHLGTKNDIFFITKIGECYFRLGDVATAEICREKADEMGAYYD